MTRREVLAQRLALLVPALLLGGAYLSQYGFGLYPCEMCWWQRWPHFAAVALALLSFAVQPRRAWIALAALAIAASGVIGVFHAGVEYHWWQGLSHCSLPPSASDDPLAAVLAQPITRCDEAAWRLFGVSLAGFNALFSLGGALAVFILLRGKRAPARRFAA